MNNEEMSRIVALLQERAPNPEKAIEFFEQSVASPDASFDIVCCEYQQAGLTRCDRMARSSCSDINGTVVASNRCG